MSWSIHFHADFPWFTPFAHSVSFGISAVSLGGFSNIRFSCRICAINQIFERPTNYVYAIEGRRFHFNSMNISQYSVAAKRFSHLRRMSHSKYVSWLYKKASFSHFHIHINIDMYVFIFLGPFDSTKTVGLQLSIRFRICFPLVHCTQFFWTANAHLEHVWKT